MNQTGRQEEEAHLEETLAIVRSNVESYGREVAKIPSFGFSTMIL